MSTEHTIPDPNAPAATSGESISIETPPPARDDPPADPRIAEIEADLAEMKDRWIRAEAETQNVRARAKLRNGFIGVERSFLGLLERHGIKSQDPTGALFDPNLHQAMQEQESADHPAGTVLQAWTQAWTLHGRLLRPAMVVVAKAPAAALGGEASVKDDDG